MALAVLGSAPKDSESLATWAFTHMAHHRDIIRVIYQVSLLALDEFLLDPFDPNNLDTWTAQHQIMHQQMDAVLGIAAFDLSQLDWSDPSLLSSWMVANANEHYQAGNLLGLG